MLAVDAAVALITWSPYFIWLMILGNPPVHNLEYLITRFAFSLFTIVYLINTVITPIIYYIFNSDFKVSLSAGNSNFFIFLFMVASSSFIYI